MKLIATRITLDLPTTLYQEKQQQEYFRVKAFEQKTWQDARDNTANVGDLFAFVFFNEDKMEFYRIVDIAPPLHANGTQTLHISPVNLTMSFTNYKQLENYHKHIYFYDTTPLRWHSRKFLDVLKKQNIQDLLK